MAGTRSEDLLIFYACTPKVTKTGLMQKALVEFCKKKQSIDVSDRFNLILFQKDGPYYYEDFTFNYEEILNNLKKVSSKIERANIAGGLFLACTFIIDVFKKISEKAFRLIVISDASSLKIPDHYIPAIQNLIEKVKDMPFFIDIVRIRTKDHAENEKLKKLANSCGGDLYELNKFNQLLSVLSDLSDKKRVDTSAFWEEKINYIIDANRPFYENLAEEPAILIDSETCAICFKKDDRTIVKCTNCGTIAHMSCWAQWAKSSNIGIPHVFRCHHCFNLIKLDESFVKIVQSGGMVEEPIEEILEVKTTPLMDFLREREQAGGPQMIRTEDPMAIPEDEYEPIAIERIEEKEEDGWWNVKEEEVNLIFCPNCARITDSYHKKCPHCDFPLQ